MAVLKTLGDWLRGSRWTQALEQANIATSGIAESFLQAAHFARTRRAHQVTASTLYFLQHKSYQQHCSEATESENVPMKFEDWCNERSAVCPQFKYWAPVLELELCMLVFVRSIRESYLDMYIDALTELVPCFFTLDHTNYARWISLHLRHMRQLEFKHPNIAEVFAEGKFTVRITLRSFSCIAIDHAHEQNNAFI